MITLTLIDSMRRPMSRAIQIEPQQNKVYLHANRTGELTKILWQLGGTPIYRNVKPQYIKQHEGIEVWLG